MADTDTFQCSVITPERAVLECDAKFVAFPAHDGEMGMLNHRAALICKLGIGIMRIEMPNENAALFVDGGFAQIVDNRLTILTDKARKPDELDAATVEKNLVEAHAMKITDDASFEARSDAIRSAQVQLKLVKPS